MALDAPAIKCLAEEIHSLATGGRIDKIHQPEKDEIVLHIRTFTDSFRLVLSAGSSHPRLHFTETKKSNPLTAPLFCMLLRKHLGSGKIIGVRQKDFERIIIMDIESRDELGDVTVKHLITEIMGRHSNIILTDSSMKIIDCIKHVDITVSSVRQVLPGMIYEFPPEQDKIPLTEFEGKLPPLHHGTTLSKSLLGAISGISPLTAREIIYRAYGVADMHTGEVSDISLLEKSLAEMKQRVLNSDFSPCIIKDESAHKMIDFSAVDIMQYEGLMKVTKYPLMNEVTDKFYSGRDALERMKQKTADITKLLTTLLERCYKKKIILTQTIKDAENKEKHKIYGDLITSNLYAVEENAKSVTVVDYYDPEGRTVTIQLDPMLTAAQNAQRYYKKYTKAKTAETEAAGQLALNEIQTSYLESTLAAVENCTGEADINAIRQELAEEGFLKRSGKKGQKPTSSKPVHFVAEGFDIFAGKNNTQNDQLTLKTANSSDLWFHTKQIHGSHVIIKLGLDKDVPENVIRIAAEIAAYYSKGRESNQVPVDFTTVKNVKKPNGAKPGMVIYDSYNTLYVKPNSHEDLQV